MYYVMSIPEILVLLFVLGLWMISIFFCYKRYEKINTIERADIPNFNAKNPNQSLDTQSCHSLSKSKNNSSNNVNTSANCTDSMTNMTYNHHLYMTNKNNQSFNELNSCFGTNNSIVCNNFLYEKLNTQANPNFCIVDESKITNSKTSRVELVTYQKYHRYKKNVYSNQFSSYTPQYVQNKPYLGLTQFKAVMGQSLSRRNINLESQSCLNCSKSDISNCLQKSNSEPALKELFSDVKKQKTSLDNYGMVKSNSIEDGNDVETSRTYTIKNKRARLNYNNKSFNDNNLLDPHLIPKVIQKSLIDLHKKSVWNLTHKPQQQNKTKSNSKNALNFLHLKSSKSKESNGATKSASQNNFTTVVTQMKNGTEIKMKVNDNFV